MRAEVVIVGAGPAGSAAALFLQRAGREVLLLERGDPPKPPLCGEFLSPDLVDRLDRLGVGEELRSLGLPDVNRVEFFLGRASIGRASFARALPARGLGISRSVLDQRLRHRSADLGATLLTGTWVRSVTGGPDEGYRLKTSRGEFDASVVLLATGKHSPIPHGQHLEPRQRGGPGWVGARLHLRAKSPEDNADSVQLFFFKNGYVGLCPIEDGHTNLCALLAPEVGPDAFAGGRLCLAWLAAQSRALSDRLTNFESPATPSSAGNLHFGKSDRSPVRDQVLRIGDAAGMLAPLVGSGIGMALESAELAAGLVLRRLRGEVSSSALLHRYEDAWRERFESRLRLSHRIQGLLLDSIGRRSLLGIAGLWPGLVDRLFEVTRGRLVETA